MTEDPSSRSRSRDGRSVNAWLLGVVSVLSFCAFCLFCWRLVRQRLKKSISRMAQKRTRATIPAPTKAKYLRVWKMILTAFAILDVGYSMVFEAFGGIWWYEWCCKITNALTTNWDLKYLWFFEVVFNVWWWGSGCDLWKCFLTYTGADFETDWHPDRTVQFVLSYFFPQIMLERSIFNSWKIIEHFPLIPSGEMVILPYAPSVPRWLLKSEMLKFFLI